jgi:MOSC domain-containing protein YiiM
MTQGCLLDNQTAIVVSVNLGKKREVNWRGKIVETGIFKSPVAESIVLGKSDVDDDAVVDRKYHGGIDKACYLFGTKAYPVFKEYFPDVDYTFGAFGENITLNHFDETTIRIGDQFSLGEAVIEIAQPRQPCFKLGIRFGTQKVVKFFLQTPYPGAYVRVIKGGKVSVGDTLILLNTHCGNPTLADMHSLFGLQSNNKLLAKMALRTPALADSFKRDVARKFKITL